MHLPPILFASSPGNDTRFQLNKISTYIFKAPVQKPVISTLTTVNVRVALLVKVEDAQGGFGWGEVYATLPSFSADHKIHLIHQIIAPLLKNQTFISPSACWSLLEKKTIAMQIQTGEFGPFSAVIAGIDCAIWDLLARQHRQPLAEFLGGQIRPLPVYASGLNPADGPEVVRQSRALGFKAFKQKIGFGKAIDTHNLATISAELHADEKLMVDVNQGWQIDQVRDMAPTINQFPLSWIEEPLLANASAQDWQACAALLEAPLAGGENLQGKHFEVQSAWLGVIQPDLGKWGGVTMHWAIAQNALAQHLLYCPHWLGSGIGLTTSAQLLSAVGGDGLLEVDVNENPLRELLAQPYPLIQDGKLHLTNAPGIGVVPNLEKASAWLTHYQETPL